MFGPSLSSGLKIADRIAVVAVGEALVGCQIDIVGDDAGSAVGEDELNGVRMSRRQWSIAVHIAHVGGSALGIGSVANGGHRVRSHVRVEAVGVVPAAGGPCCV